MAVVVVAFLKPNRPVKELIFDRENMTKDSTMYAKLFYRLNKLPKELKTYFQKVQNSKSSDGEDEQARYPFIPQPLTRNPRTPHRTSRSTRMWGVVGSGVVATPPPTTTT